MQVLLDIQGTQSRAHSDRGIARYLRELAAALRQWHPGAVDAFLLNPDLPPPAAIEGLTATGRLCRVDAPGEADGGIYHVGSPFEHVSIDRLWPSYARRGSMKLVAIVYDLIPEVFSDVYLGDPLIRRWYRARLELIRQADKILAISQATANDVISRLRVSANSVAVIGGGVGDDFRPPTSREAAFAATREAVPGVESGYILYTGGIEPRKNVDRLLEAYAALPNDLRDAHQLVVVCRVLPDQRQRLDATLAKLGISDRVVFPGYVADSTLVALYQACSLFVFPSLYEGYGLPIAEAIACGAPVIAAGTSSLVELVAEEAQFDPRDTAAITAAIESALTDEVLRARLRRLERPTWRGVADRTVEAYQTLEPAQPRRRRRPRIAFVSPLPPQSSGVADASYRLLDELKRHIDIDAFVDGDRESTRAPSGIGVAAIGSFDRCERARGGYDEVVYALGNSEFHAETLALLKVRPGVVIAHDLRLSGLCAWIAHHRPDLEPRSFHEILQSMYTGRIPESLGREGWLDLDDADRYGIYMAREVLASSKRFLVHSKHAAQLARLEARPADVEKIGVIPFGVPSPEAVPHEKAGSQPLLATFGIATAAKQTEKVIEAFATVAEVDEETRFAVVGSFPDTRERAAALRLADELGIRDRIDFTGRIDQDAFHDWMSRTTIGVQLRSWSNGETSAAVTDCLARGIPTVVTGIGSAAELPDECVVKVEREIGARALGLELRALLGDPARRSHLADAAQGYARSNSFERTAEALYQVVRDEVRISPDSVIGGGAVNMKDTEQGAVHSVRGTAPKDLKSWELYGDRRTRRRWPEANP
jgi:glycosyltransferase involved in cell wall biosynthesis